MTETLKKKLISLADRYEIPEFTEGDPSQFLRWYEPAEGRGSVADVEVASFIAAMLAFGNRKQFIPKIREVLETSDRSLGSITEWLKAGTFAKDFPTGETKFYRFYSYDDMQVFFGELADILKEYETLGEYFKNKELSSIFPKSSIVPKGRTSANKRIHMFLRWMVRRNSPVDLGLWTWANPADLLIPLDTHVMQEAAKLGLIPQKASASHKTAELLTAALSQAFPGDPCRGDFALFGLGVDVV